MKQTKKVWLRYCFLCVCLFLSMWLSCINQLFIIRNVAVGLINDFRLIIMLDRRPTIDCDLPHPWGKRVNETVPLSFITNFKLNKGHYCSKNAWILLNQLNLSGNSITNVVCTVKEQNSATQIMTNFHSTEIFNGHEFHRNPRQIAHFFRFHVFKWPYIMCI